MKKLLLSITLMGACLTTFAQFKGAPIITFGVQAGVNFSNVSSSYSDANYTLSTSSITGFHIGGLADFSFGTLSIQPGLFYTTKGGEITTTSNGKSNQSKSTLNYLEIPVNFFYKIPAGNGKVFLGGGPYLGFGVSGKYKDTHTDASGVTTISIQNVTFGNTVDDVNSTDFGLNFVAGYQLNKGLMFKLSHGLGLTNTGNVSGETDRNRVTSISVGYSFK